MATNDPIGDRRRFQQRTEDRSYYKFEGIPAPPYHFEACRMVWAAVAVDAAAARALVPADLELTDAHVGGICIWRAAATRHFGAVTGVLVAVEVAGFDTPDGIPGLYRCAEYLTEPALSGVGPAFSAGALRMDALADADFDTRPVLATVDGELLLTMSVRPTAANPGSYHSLNYVSRNSSGELVSFSTPYNFRCMDAELADFQFGAAMPEPIRALAPREGLFAYDFAELNFTFSVPIPLDLAALRARTRPAAGRQPSDPGADLLKRGLTQAEVRLALGVGRGLTLRAAALELGVTENTARSTLKQVYDKLSVRKQSELARLVAGLEFRDSPA